MMMNDASDEVYLAMPKALKARGFLAVECNGKLFYIKVMGKNQCVLDSEWIENSVVDRQMLSHVDEEIRSYGY
jgi:hypothetical protein